MIARIKDTIDELVEDVAERDGIIDRLMLELEECHMRLETAQVTAQRLELQLDHLMRAINAT